MIGRNKLKYHAVKVDAGENKGEENQSLASREDVRWNPEQAHTRTKKENNQVERDNIKVCVCLSRLATVYFTLFI